MWDTWERLNGSGASRLQMFLRSAFALSPLEIEVRLVDEDQLLYMGEHAQPAGATARATPPQETNYFRPATLGRPPMRPQLASFAWVCVRAVSFPPLTAMQRGQNIRVSGCVGQKTAWSLFFFVLGERARAMLCLTSGFRNRKLRGL